MFFLRREKERSFQYFIGIKNDSYSYDLFVEIAVFVIIFMKVFVINKKKKNQRKSDYGDVFLNYFNDNIWKIIETFINIL